MKRTQLQLIGLMQVRRIYPQTMRVLQRMAATSEPQSRPQPRKVKHLRGGVSANQQKPICHNRQKRDWCVFCFAHQYKKGSLPFLCTPIIRGVFLFQILGSPPREGRATKWRGGLTPQSAFRGVYLLTGLSNPPRLLSQPLPTRGRTWLYQ